VIFLKFVVGRPLLLIVPGIKKTSYTASCNHQLCDIEDGTITIHTIFPGP